MSGRGAKILALVPKNVSESDEITSIDFVNRYSLDASQARKATTGDELDLDNMSKQACKELSDLIPLSSSLETEFTSLSPGPSNVVQENGSQELQKNVEIITNFTGPMETNIVTILSSTQVLTDLLPCNFPSEREHTTTSSPGSSSAQNLEANISGDVENNIEIITNFEEPMETNMFTDLSSAHELPDLLPSTSTALESINNLNYNSGPIEKIEATKIEHFSNFDNSDDDKNYVPNNSDMSSEDDTEEEENKPSGNKSRRRWREAAPENWKRIKNRTLKDKSLPYYNYKGIEQPAKSPKAIDCSKCKFKCTEKFTENERKIICSKYWILSTYDRKKDFILFNVSSSKPLSRRPRKENAVLRQNAKQYHFSKQSDKIQVCQNFFLKTLNISNHAILSAFKGKDELGHFSGTDKRGRKAPSNKTKDNVAAKVRAHIERFPCMESHYTRKSTARKYLDSNLTITKMYSLYKEQCSERGYTETVSLITYRRIFCKEYNLSFFHPKKDQCLTCVSYQQATPDAKKNMEETYNAHLKRKNEAQEAKAADKERAKTDETFMTVSFDLQSVLQIPSTEVSLTYYMRKLIMYNLTVYEAVDPNRAFCFCWTECNGKKGSSEVGTCLLKYIKSLPPEVKAISLFSDTCGGQNRNLQIAALLLHVVQNTHLETIEQKFLESGHSFMEVDSMHSAIERQKKFVSVFCVNDWLNIFKLARSKRVRNKDKPPYEAVEITFEEFLDLKKLSATLIKNKSIDENGDKVNWLKVKCFKYEKACPDVIKYRYDYSSNYVSIKISAFRRGRKSDPVKTDLQQLYFHPLKISQAKKNDLLTMCKKKVIPEVFHPWFMNLPCDNNVKDLVPEPAIQDSDIEDD